jgi:hypothetical protein
MLARYRVFYYGGMSFAILMVVAVAVLVPWPTRRCEIATADIFCERYRWHRGIEGTHSGIERCIGVDLE